MMRWSTGMGFRELQKRHRSLTDEEFRALFRWHQSHREENQLPIIHDNSYLRQVVIPAWEKRLGCQSRILLPLATRVFNSMLVEEIQRGGRLWLSD